MEMYWSMGGRRNPDFSYKVKIRRHNDNISEAMHWCNDYSPGDSTYFKRYYVDFRNGKEEAEDSEYVTFQFEWEEPAVLFALKWS